MCFAKDVLMPEMFRVIPPPDALEAFLAALCPEGHSEERALVEAERVATADALDRVLAERLAAHSPLPAFDRGTMDGFAVRSADTYGASESLPAYLTVVGEVPMGRSVAGGPVGDAPSDVAGAPAAPAAAPDPQVGPAQAALIHTGGMLPAGADAVVPVEQTQRLDATTIEVLRPVAPGENVVGIGEDVKDGQVLFDAGHALRPQDIGGLMALGITEVAVARRPTVAIISTGDEIVPPECEPAYGQIRDINTYTISGLVAQAGGIPLPQGIVPDDYHALLSAARAGWEAADVVVISAGSSVSVRDLTAEVVGELGRPGVIVHGVALKPGKPTILAVCGGKPVIGLPGNPVSAMVAGGLFIAPLLARLQGRHDLPAKRCAVARLSRNVASAPGREDHVPVRVVEREGELWAEPVLGKSNLIYTLVHADGTFRVSLDVNGVHQGETVEVELF